MRRQMRALLLSNGGRNLKFLSARFRSADKEGVGYLPRRPFKDCLYSFVVKGRRNAASDDNDDSDSDSERKRPSAAKKKEKEKEKKGRADRLQRDEIRWLLHNLEGRRTGHYMYQSLPAVLSDGAVLFDGDEGSDDAIFDDGLLVRNFEGERWAMRDGSVGEWLQNVATPLDRKNFACFMKIVEDFEKDRGLDERRAHLEGRTGNAIVIRLGPMLNVAMKFYVE